jgi:hypothetical protein
MPAIEYDYKELNALANRVNESGPAISRITLNEGLRKIGRLFVPATGTGPMANATPKVTGKLARSTVFQIIGGAMNQVLEIRQAAKSPEGIYYGYIVREGSGLWGPTKQPIRPKNAKYLRFEIVGQIFFRKEVKGQRPNKYHRRVLAQLMPQVQVIMRQMAEKIGLYISGKAVY